jgi:hypothetical protein
MQKHGAIVKAVGAVKFVGWSLLIMFFIFFCLVICLWTYLSWENGKCHQTSVARQFLLEKLPPEQAKTLRSVSTMSDENSNCSMTFVFKKDGKEIEVGGSIDEIHGTKFSSSDDGETADFLARQR